MKPSRQITQRAWLWSALAVTAMWVFLFACCDVRFAINDDQFLMRSFAGVSPGGPITFQYFLMSIYCYPLAWLGRLFPGVAWFSVTEIALMWLSGATVCKSLHQCFARKNHGWLGFGVGICFLLLFWLYFGARLTFTTVAASLGAACVAQVVSVDCENGTDRQILRGMLYALVLLVLCYGLRPVVSFSTLSFCGIAYLLHLSACFGKAKKRSLRPMLITLVLVVGVMGGLMALREVEIDVCGQQGPVAWDDARTDVMDFLNLSTIPADVRQQAGWSDTQVALLSNWYTMEEAISTESFQTVAQHSERISPRATPGVAVMRFRIQSPLFVRLLLVLFGLGVLCLLGLALRRQGVTTFLALIFGGGGCLLLLAYLAWQGRLPYRAVMVPVLPAAALVFCLVPQCLPDKRLFTVGLCAFLAFGVVWFTVPAMQGVGRAPSQPGYDIYAAMDDMAVQNPDRLFVYSGQLVADARLFPDFSDGLPTNLMFWGGWQRGLSDYQSKLAAFGLDGNHFTPADWLHPSIRFLTSNTEPDELLVTHLREKLGEDLSWQQEKMDESLYSYRFYLNR